MQFTRVTKIEFSKFGGDDVKGWMYKCQQFFKVDNVPDEQKVPLISIHLFDIALMWHRQFMRLLGSDTVPWLVYRGAIMQRFGNSFDDPLGELKNCKFESSIEEYQNSFDRLLSRVDNREDQAISFYMAGLPTDIELAVRMFKPQTLSVAYSLSKLQVKTNEATKKRNKAPLFTTPKFSNYSGRGNQITSPKPLALPAPNVNWRNKTTTPQIAPIRRRLSQKEMEEKKAKNLCFYCDQRYVPSYKCTGQDETSQPNQILAEGPQISLHALNGIQGNQTLRVVGMVGKIPVHILIDTGSTHNFIDVNVATKSGMSVPNCLPPKRGHDHKIPLKEGTQPINIRPYRHPPTQKDAIESMVKELLDSGVIRHSQSSFSSPVVMVKKKDGSWRMCIDYRQLNKQTVKDKFLIPLIEELIDELHGSITHEGHYEFLVIPFGLTNAPSSFQALMNEVFRPFLRKFTLVFFDDILVYSTDMQSYVKHLIEVLSVMREQQLYAKASKCIFGAPQVEYLGHIISGKGVSTYPNKIQTMVDWPVPTTLKQSRGFLGLTGYYRRFVKSYASISLPLSALLKKNAFDASGVGIGVVLQQKGHPIAFLSKTLAPKHQALSTYEKEFLAVIQVLKKWRGYLLDRHFIIKTDHYSLKYLLDQRITTPAQMKWLPKLIGFDYEIVYKKGTENVVVDALSRIHGQIEFLQMDVTALSSELYDKIQKGWNKDSQLKAKIEKLQSNSCTSKHYSWSNGQLLRKGKLVVSNDETLRNDLTQHFYNGPTGGHSGMQTTTKRMGSLLHWKKMRNHIKQYIRQCDTCQRFKPKLVPYPGLLQPLPIPSRVWTEISMYFIDGLPMSKGSTIIMKELFSLLQVKLHTSTEYHPQSDGQTEVVNRSLECYLRCMCGEKPKEWVNWIPLAEYCVVDAVDRSLSAREVAIDLLKFHIKRSQDRMKSLADRHRSDIEFEEGVWVYVKLQPYRKATLRQGKQNKLLPKYFGPFLIIKKVGKVAYKLQLRNSSQIHPVFHVSQLKLYKGPVPKSSSQIPAINNDGLILEEPLDVLDRRMAKRGNVAVVYVLIQWIN
ncbi:putative mitochondrial protein [Tanacetum coccineum]